MTFGQPNALLALTALPVLWALVRWAERRRRAAIARLGDPRLVAALGAGEGDADRRWRTRLRLAAVALVVVALARPQWGARSETVRQTGIQVMVALDVSESMLADDVKPSRLERAKLEVAALMDRMAGDEVGLVLFAGAAFIQFPLTSDYGVARAFLEGARPGIISRGGSRLADAITTAQRGFDARRPGQKAIVLISDGEDSESDAVAAAEAANAEDVMVFAVGMGTAEGATIPVFDARGEHVGTKRDRDGRVVTSRLEESRLRAVADATGAAYFPGTTAGFAALGGALGSLQAGETAARVDTTRAERFQIFLGLAVALLLVAELWTRHAPASVATVGSRARRPAPGNGLGDVDERVASASRLTVRPPAPTASRWASVTLCAALGAAAAACGGEVARHNAAGNAAYDAGEYATAEAAYAVALEAEPEAAAIAYNAGNTAFRRQDVPRARGLLERALTLDTGALAARAWFTLGHLAYNVGELDAAIEAYIEVLRRDPDDVDAKVNLELALRRREEAGATPSAGTPSPEGTPSPGGGTATPGGTGTSQPGDGTQEAGATPPGGSPQPGASPGEGTPSPGETRGPGEGPQAGGTPGATAGTPGSRSGSGRPADGAATAAPGRTARGMDAAEARRLLEVIGRNARTLQEHLQQRYVVPGGEPPEQDW